MKKIKIGCGRITWAIQDNGQKSDFSQVLPQIAGTGYAGVEAFADDILAYEGCERELRSLVQSNGLALTAAYYKTDLCDPAAAGNEIEGALRLARCLSRSGCELIVLGTGGKESADAEFKLLLDSLNTIAREVREQYKLTATIHTHYGSMVQTREQLARLMDGTDPDFVFLVPDTGHWVRGGIHLMEAFEAYLWRITYVHYKDVDEEGRWRRLGKGMIDHAAVTRLLVDKGYTGWIIAEEEEAEAIREHGAVACARENLAHLTKLLKESSRS